jgi:hypothetical protein
MRRKALQLIGIIFLSACSSTPQNAQTYLDSKSLGTPSAKSFKHCHAYGCKAVMDIELTDTEWKSIGRAFKPAPKTAEAEREDIKTAIGKFEKIIGPITRTQTDQAGTFRKLGNDQLDCVDESTNTTTYLMVMAEKGLIKFHEVNGPTMRLPIIHAGRWPHQTAVIRETATGELFAVDSWFHDNGENAEIVPLKAWKDGWKPENTGDGWL